MDLTRDAMSYLAEQNKVEIVDIFGKKYSTKSLTRIREGDMPIELTFTSLDSIVEYIESGIDELGDLFVEVSDPVNVYVYSGLNADMQRKQYIHSQAFVPPFSYGQFMDAEAFIIRLQSLFADNEGRTDKAGILKFVGNMQEEHVKTVKDDGVSQAAVVKTGIVTVEEAVCPNPVVLAPFRTFIEVEQPASKFILRLKEGGLVALFEADGGAWKREAVQNIMKYLRSKFDAGDKCRAHKICIVG
jgi:hypothetical protein